MILSIAQRVHKHAAPPPRLIVSQWADRERRLSPESSAESGAWRTARVPYLREMMDAICADNVSTVVIQSSAQVGKTELLLNVIGYHIQHDPAPILFILPSLEMAESVSKDRLAPMIRDTPALRERFSDPKSRDSGNTLLHRKFPGGQITLAGSNSPTSLASRPIRIVLCDEVDRYPASAGTEGDPVNLAIKRTATFFNRRIVLTSTPTIKGISRIERAYLDSDQRRYVVPCPHCEHRHILKWEHVKWTDSDPSTAIMVCPECGGVIEERHKGAMLARGEWIADRPCKGIAGFHLNELYSPWRRWSDVVADFLSAKGSPETLKTWVNTSLGETWEETSEKYDPESLMTRRENYTPSALPSGILYLTAGVDIQDNRIEAEVIGWRQDGRDVPPESWGVEYRVLMGDPAQTSVWDDLDHFLLDTWTTEDGRALRVGAVCVDSGGHHTAQVYAYCAARRGRHVHAIKGLNGPRPIWNPRAGKSRKYAAVVWHVGVDSAKDAWYSRLRTTEPGPGYCHFPIAYDSTFFDGLTAEQVRTRYSKGKPIREWFLPSGRRNEPIDIRAYGLAALLARPVKWDQLARAAGTPRPNAPAPKAAPKPQAPANSFIRRPAGSSWIRR